MSEQRLIDANALGKILSQRYKEIEAQNGLYDHYACGFDDAISYVDEAPTLDAVPVVRCKDCIHRGYDACPMCHDEYYYDEDDGFCHMGAKMDGGAENA